MTTEVLYRGAEMKMKPKLSAQALAVKIIIIFRTNDKTK